MSGTVMFDTGWRDPVFDHRKTEKRTQEDGAGAEFVQAIGRKFVLYRQAADPAKRKIII